MRAIASADASLSTCGAKSFGRQQRRAGAFVAIPGTRRRQVHARDRDRSGGGSSCRAGRRARPRAGIRRTRAMLPERSWRMPCRNQSNSAGRARKMPRSTSAEAALRVRLGIGERQRRAPRAAEHQPAVDAAGAAQPFEVGDEVRRGVVGELGERRRAPGAALVEQHDAPEARGRKSGGDAAGSRRPARRAGTRPARRRGLPQVSQYSCVDGVDGEPAVGVRLDLREQDLAARCGIVGHRGRVPSVRAPPAPGSARRRRSGSRWTGGSSRWRARRPP